MPPLLNRAQPDVSLSDRFSTAVLLITFVIAYIGTSVQHSLLTNAVAWIIIWLYANISTRGQKSIGRDLGQRLSWCAGGLLALGQLCQRVAVVRGIAWANGLLPVVVYLCIRSDIVNLDGASSAHPQSPGKAKASILGIGSSGRRMSVLLLALCAIVATFTAVGSNTAIVLGLSYGVVEALGLLLVEKAALEAQSGQHSSDGDIYSANGLLSNSSKPTLHASGQMMTVRSVSLVAATLTSIAAISFESFTFGGLAYWGILGQLLGEKWVVWNGIVGFIFGAFIVGVHAVFFWTLLMTIQRQGSLRTSFVPLWGAVVSILLLHFSASRIWFALLCVAWNVAFFREHSGTSSSSTRSAQLRRLCMLVTLISCVVLFITYLREPYERVRSYRTPIQPYAAEVSSLPPPKPLAPLAFKDTKEHPISQLVHEAGASWQQVLLGQSQSLDAAVEEYKRRYGMPPPPNFDKWYEFAKRKNSMLIDEYDTVYKTILPFWGLSPATIRARAREAIGYHDNNLMGLAIRNGKVTTVNGGPDWLQQAAVGMIAPFVDYLPDMDLAFNVHDEPRVVVPHDDLSRLVDLALNENVPASLRNPVPRNSFSSRPADLNDGMRFPECRTTKFNFFAHQPTWHPSRLSCPTDSPARNIDESQATDNLTAYAIGELGFVYNQTAFSDICNSPSLSSTFGFFDRPNAFNIVHDLYPIFSQSKISSFQDILYPSPWYWYGKVTYNPLKDVEWSKKTPSLLWRGSTTGGYSRSGGWRRQHRQHMVKKLNALDEAKILQTSKDYEDNRPLQYGVVEVDRQDFKRLMDVHFSHIGQCDDGDCEQQREFFKTSPAVEQQDHWKWRFLLDMDGNAFSGRFYAFLKSKSLVFKMSIFREWHQEWLRPWVHYIPLSLRGDEVLESVRFFASKSDDELELGRKVAEQGSAWAHKTLRNEDFEIWFFRVLLEYARVIDDNRAEIGYAVP